MGTAAPACLPWSSRAILRVLNYHRINYAPPDFLLDPEVVSADPELFDRQVAFCVKHFDVISFRDLDEMLAGRRKLPARALIISFDDGYEDNYRYAFPILQRHGATGTFFLATDYLGSDRLFWWDEVALALNAHDGERLQLTIAGIPHVFDLASQPARRHSTRLLLKALKAVPNEERVKTVRGLSESTNRRTATRLPRQAMTWPEAGEMAAHGMEIGSHSVTHPILSQVPPGGLQQEIAGSKAAIESRLGVAVSVFSYPVGGEAHVNAAVRAAVKDAGYRFGVTYINGFNRVTGGIDPYALRRLHVDGLSEQEFRMRLVAPHL